MHITESLHVVDEPNPILSPQKLNCCSFHAFSNFSLCAKLSTSFDHFQLTVCEWHGNIPLWKDQFVHDSVVTCALCQGDTLNPVCSDRAVSQPAFPGLKLCQRLVSAAGRFHLFVICAVSAWRWRGSSMLD